MVRKEVEVKNEKGLHLTPCGMIATTAQRFQSEINIANSEMKVNAKSVMSLLTLAAYKGTKIIIEAKGIDEKEAVEEIVKLFENNFGEE